MVMFAVATFIFLHAIVFAFHSFTVFRYESLYDQIQARGAIIQMSDDFLRTHNRAHNRFFWTRPDILSEEIGIMQSGTISMMSQYKNDTYRLHDTIVQNIKFLSISAELGQELIYPWQEEVLRQASVIQKQLRLIPLGDINQLTALLQTSSDLVQATQKNIDYAQKKLILQDILAFKHEMIFIADVYRMNQLKPKTLDIKEFWSDFRIAFTELALKNDTPETLSATLWVFKTTTQAYREGIVDIRLKNWERRIPWVEAEQKKWTDPSTFPPLSPLPDVYSLIYISLEKQMMYVYEDNELILSTSITSGRQNFETIRWIFHIYIKQRGKLMKSPFPDQEYELWVDYWLGFTGAYGIHDACNSTDCWRTRFGGASYVYNGSHGCINTPYNAVKFIYSWAKVGTTVYVR